MAIPDLNTCVKLATGGGAAAAQTRHFTKDNRIAGVAAAATVAARISSCWQYGGAGWSAGAVPTTGAIPTSALSGALKFTNPGGGRKLYLAGGVLWSTQIGTLYLMDRLFHIGSLSGTNTGAQTVQGSPASPALTRYTDGIGNQGRVEITTQIGASSTTITANYTNEAGTSGQVSEATAIGNTGLREATRIIPLPLAAGDAGLRAINTVTLAATTGTAGVFGVSIVHPILAIPFNAIGSCTIADLVNTLPVLPEITTDACLYWEFLANGATVPQFGGFPGLQLLEN